MPKISKLCQVAYHSTRLDGTKVFILLCGHWTKRQLPPTKPILRSKKKYLLYMPKNDYVIFWLAIFRSSTHHRGKLMAYLGSWGNPEQETWAFYAKIFIWKFDLIWPDLDRPSVKIQGGWHLRFKYHRYLTIWYDHIPTLPISIGSSSISASEITPKACVARHVCDCYFIVTLCDLTLTFLSMPLLLMQ